MKTNFIICIAALAAFASCSKSNVTDDGQVTPTDGQIRVFTGIDAPGSKAVSTQATGLTDAQFIKVDATTKPADFSDAATGYKVSEGAVVALLGAVSFDSAIEYDKNDANAWLVAYHPAGTLATNVVTWTIDGSTDVLRTDAIWDAGKYSSPLTGEGVDATKLTFNHQLSQVEVVCKAEETSNIDAVRAAWGQIKSIKFVDAPTTMTYTLTSVMIANGAVIADFSMLKDYKGAAFEAIDMPKNDNTAVNAMAMLAPVAATVTESFKLKITTEGPTADVADDITKEVAVSLDGTTLAMAKGKTHNVVLTFKADAKNIEIKSTTIEAWTVGDGGTADVEKPVGPSGINLL